MNGSNEPIQLQQPEGRKRPHVLILTKYFLPGRRGGGSVTSLRNLILALSDEYCFTVVTGSRDLGTAEPYSAIQRESLRGFPAQVVFADPTLPGLRTVRQALSNDTVSVIYLNSFFSPLFSIAPLMLRKLGLARGAAFILAPRGELLRGALATKAWKKRIHLTLGRFLGLCDDVIWKASSESEAARIRELFGSAPAIRIVPNLPTVPPVNLSRTPKSAGHLRVLYLSRIAENKNLEFVVEVLRTLEFPVRLTIAGPIADQGYWNRCRAALGALPETVRYEYLGPVSPERVFDLYRHHDVLFLPTKGENYGHVIVEAMTSGCPVLISRRTQWKGLEEAGVGWDIPLVEPGRFSMSLRTLYHMNAEVHRNMSTRARVWSRKAVQYDETVHAHKALLEMGLRTSRSTRR